MKATSNLKILIFTGVLALLFCRVLYFSYLGERIDKIAVTLIIIAILTLLIPFEKISSFKAGDVEVTLERQDVINSINSLKIEEIEQERLKAKLKLCENNLKYLVNSKILWIDDKQPKILGEKRLLRYLGVQITPAISSAMASEILTCDQDFDLIISDVQREGAFFEFNHGIKVHDGVNFIEFAVEHNLISKDTQVIFYAAYEHNRLFKFTERIRVKRKEIIAVNNIADLIYEVVNLITIRKNSKTQVVENKIPTSIAKVKP